MWKLALVAALAVAVSQDAETSDGDTACERDYPAVHEWVNDAMADGQPTRDRMVARLDRILGADPALGTPCLLKAAMDRVVVMSVSDEHARVVAGADAMLRSRAIGRAPDLEARAHMARGVAFSATGRAVDAKQAFIEAAALVPRLPARRATEVLTALAEEAQGEGDWSLAGNAYRRAMALVRDSAAADPAAMRIRTGRLLTSYAYHLQLQAAADPDPTRRASLARQMIAAADTAAFISSRHETDSAAERVYDRGKTALALIDGAYGLALLGEHARASRQIDDALALVRDDVQAFFPYALPAVWLRRAETEQFAGRLAQAADAARRSRDVCRAQEDIACEADALERLALVAEQDDRLAPAAGFYRQAIAIRDIEWERGRLQDWSASTFATSQTPYRGLTRVLVRQGRPAEAFVVLDGARARALRDMRARLVARDRLTPEQQLRVDSLLDALQTERISLAGGLATPEERATVTLRVSRLNAQIDAQTRSRSTPLGTLDVHTLQRTLRQQGQTLVSFLVGEHETVAFVVTPDTLVARVLPTTSRDVTGLMREAGGPWSEAATGEAVRLRPLHALHERLVRPIRDVLPARGSLVVLADGPLADLPFGALVESPADDYTSARFLARRYAISTDLAAALLVADAGRTEGTFSVDLVAFGRSRFGGQAVEGQRGPVLSNLPNVTAELALIRTRVGDLRTAVDDRATEAKLNADAGRARVVHVASHAEADAAFPLYSKIYLWDDPDDPDDGVVHLFELQALRLPAELVVLSGCSTAAGREQTGEGTIGLQYGVRAAGAGATLATLWPVDDRATAEIVDTFYEGLTQGLAKDVALQRAQIAYIDRHPGAEASPYFWAAPVLSGDTRPVPLHAPAPTWPLALGGLALSAGAAGLVWRARSRRSARHA